MSEAPQDIPLLKLSGAQLASPEVTPSTDGLWATYEVTNIGTAPTTHEDMVCASAIYSNTQVFNAEHHFDNPVIAPNGGSHRGTVHVHADHMKINGDWELWIAIPNKGIGQGYIDEITLPFKVNVGNPHEST
jgi:hypothetical protein